MWRSSRMMSRRVAPVSACSKARYRTAACSADLGPKGRNAPTGLQLKARHRPARGRRHPDLRREVCTQSSRAALRSARKPDQQ
jgi:hypothetical protein